MARARNIKPAIMANEELGEMQPVERLLFIYLWMLADREGRLEDRPKRIKAEALPYDEADADAILQKLHRSGFILRYSVEGQRIIQVLNFAKHQAPHIREQASSLPAYNPETVDPEPSREKAQPEHNLGSAEPSPRSPDCGFSDCGFSDSLIPDPMPADAGPSQAPARNELIESFNRFWKLYPNRKDKAKANKAWHKLKPDAALVNQIFEALAKQCASADWLKSDGQFIPLPTTWLNNRRWEDEVKPAGNVHAFPGQSRHTGFDQRDYTDGLGAQRKDGSYEF